MPPDTPNFGNAKLTGALGADEAVRRRSARVAIVTPDPHILTAPGDGRGASSTQRGVAILPLACRGSHQIGRAGFKNRRFAVAFFVFRLRTSNSGVRWNGLYTPKGGGSRNEESKQNKELGRHRSARLCNLRQESTPKSKTRAPWSGAYHSSLLVCCAGSSACLPRYLGPKCRVVRVAGD